MVPRIFADAGIVDFPLHDGQLIPHPAIGEAGASSEVISPEGRTYMLAVNPTTINDEESFFLPSDYNDEFTVELFWGDFFAAGGSGGRIVSDCRVRSGLRSDPVRHPAPPTVA